MSTKTYAVVTGASSGIGREFAILLAHKKHNLILVARNKHALEDLGEVLRLQGIDVVVIAADLADETQRKRCITHLTKYKVDVLFNNAGFGDFGDFVDADWPKLNRMLQLNIVALSELAHIVGGQMQQEGHGRIVNVASTAAFFPGPKMATYYASKAYVLNFSQALAHELKPYGVTVTALCPGPTTSGFLKAANLEKSNLMKDLAMPPAASVAAFAYKKMMQGTVIAIPGASNKFQTQLPRVFPKSLIVKVVANIQKESK
jgi:short-subunit dehydrogenase